MARKRPESSHVHSNLVHMNSGGAEQSSTFFVGLTLPLDEFIRSQTARLAKIAVKMEVPPDQIENVVQEVWMDALQSDATFNGEHAEQERSSWLAHVAHSKSVNALRDLQRRATESIDANSAGSVDAKAKEAVELMEGKERGAWLAASLAELHEKDPENGRLLCERFLRRRSIQDLADETGLTVHAIHCRIGRALKKLRG